MNLDTTATFIGDMVCDHRAPAILSSFGKESMVLLHLTRSMGLDLPVIFHRDPWQPEKNKFADLVIAAWNLVVHDWCPSACGIKVNGKLETVARYQVGPNAYLDIPKNIAEPVNQERFACGLCDVIERPKSSFLHPWDLYLHGHKSSDVDEFEGPVPLAKDYQPAERGLPAVAYPLKDWSDADVWHYLNTRRVPVQNERYEREAGKLREDHARHSNDYITACVRCIDPREPDKVSCPKRHGELVPNVSNEIPRFNMNRTHLTI